MGMPIIRLCLLNCPICLWCCLHFFIFFRLFLIESFLYCIFQYTDSILISVTLLLSISNEAFGSSTMFSNSIYSIKCHFIVVFPYAHILFFCYTSALVFTSTYWRTLLLSIWSPHLRDCLVLGVFWAQLVKLILADSFTIPCNYCAVKAKGEGLVMFRFGY